MEFNPFKQAEKIAEKVESKAAKLVVYWGTFTALIAMIPIIAGFIYKCYIVVNHVIMIDEHVTKFENVAKVLTFQVGQNTRRIDEEHDAKMSFGVPVRMGNPPKGSTQGNLWYTTYVKVGEYWYIVTYKAQPDYSNKSVDIFDYYGNWMNAGEEDKPDENDIKAN
jgi:hypothetical protein